MKNVLSKLRVFTFVLKLRLLICWDFLTKPFRIWYFVIKRYLQYRKIDKESATRWEAHIKKRELENQDEFKARRSEFFCLKAQFLGALFRTCIESSFYAVTQEAPDEVDSEFLAKMDEYQQNFEKEKKEVIELLEKISEFQEIDFDSNLKDSIVGWNFNSFDKCDSITEFEQKIAEYLQSLDIK